MYGDKSETLSPPICIAESLYNRIASILFMLGMLLIAMLPLPIMADIIARHLLGFTFDGITELETLSLVLIVFLTMPYVTVLRGHIVIDMFFNLFTEKNKLRLIFFNYLLCTCISALLGYQTLLKGITSKSLTPALQLSEGFFICFAGIGLLIVCIGMFFQFLRSGHNLIKHKDWWGLCVSILLVAALFLLPVTYKLSGLRFSKLAIGSLGFLLLFTLLFLRMPIGFGLALLGTQGLLITTRTPMAAFSLVSEVPYREVANFILVAIPMFMLMGEITSLSSISRDMLSCANKWMGRMPGGLACASVGGCAGFGAICGDSLTTVITMSSVALPEMRRNNYATTLSAGSLAAGGTLGILIPPSMGFIFYSIMTEQSVGKLFVAGIVPGIILTMIFMSIIVIMVKRNPTLAPPSPAFDMADKLRALLGLLPMVALFVVVVGGIMMGMFTPGEGGAVGALCAFLYALVRRQITIQGLGKALYNTALMTGKIFVILVGVYVFGAFLATSRLPALLAEFVIQLEMNRYVVLAVIIFIYILMGCVMNIIPMMLLTLPSIYPTIETLGFDGIWFGVVTVIVMEMGMITPPIGMNVFTMASLAPDISMGAIFKGVMPFFIGMCVCVLLIILFPQLALWLPGTL